MSMLFGTGELLYSDDVFTDWDGNVLARVERPRRTWRTMFTSGGTLRIVRTDGTLLFEMPEFDAEDDDECRVTAADGIPSALVKKKKRRLAILKVEFTVQDADGAPMGTITTNAAWDSFDAVDTSGAPIATIAISGDSWTVDLRTNGSTGWDVVMLAMAVTADETYSNLPGMN
ncbi:hypothetical protein BZB76_5913 [Actinomadura pelletieri DSM 43383]|uniref:Uncharacterized protein n=1 Tax=Actinomadura pelletieri DSM 43383 TaxID=1120940 RepID=A0A495QAT4_9ACTN|nr:hypothetical protein [Actinomadura pelletieri]RKS68785.1 hypothetical protein BZB76_5913 [Actinomadura pelletieri DSM 43383]